MSVARPRIFITQPIAESAIRRLAERAEVTRNRDPLHIMLTPHIGSAEVGLREQMAHVVVDNLLAVMDGRRPPNCVNPEVL